MVHNNKFVYQVQLYSLEDYLTSTIGNIVCLYVPLFKYTRSCDLFTYLNIDKCSNRIKPPIVGEYVSTLIQETIEPTTNDEISNDTYNISSVSHSRLLQSHYLESEVCSIRLLFINLNDEAIQKTMSITDDEQTVEEQLLSKYDNIKSNVPVTCPVVSTKTDSLSKDKSVKNDEEEDDEFSCPLYCGGYKYIDYDSSDRHVTKKCKFSNHY